ncbi:MAG: tRNA (guanosine(46)-N7)-methyltransferase TrmB [Flavobacteriaceae bacterium]|nr:tRNA (guanosine(46)-N7)-methyltransferase TrmB [Flavobacteriaceae bacterium]|tara:strand:- start:1162 stop:1836 length:675 start_codon:yes stop_codon:yes gene_type:complete
MGSKNKLKRFQENVLFSNVFQPERETLEKDQFSLKGQWRASYFKNNNPIVLELGCGKGEYSVHLASAEPQKNFIGIDIKGARFWRGAKSALEENRQNVCFVRAQIELIETIFGPQEVDEIWITFPDPQIKFKRTKHRLTQPAFLSRYKHIIKPKGYIHLKTDSEFLYGYTLGLIESGWGKLDYAHHDIYHNVHAPEEATAVQTFYEKKFLDENKPITYIKFQLS